MKEIENISELRNRKGGRDLSIVNLLGKQVINDGYGGAFYWCSSCTGIDDNNDVIKSILSSTGRWIRVSQLEYLSQALSDKFISSQDGIDIDQIIGAFNVELRDVNGEKIGLMVDPDSSPPQIGISISNLNCL